MQSSGISTVQTIHQRKKGGSDHMQRLKKETKHVYINNQFSTVFVPLCLCICLVCGSAKLFTLLILSYNHFHNHLSFSKKVIQLHLCVSSRM